MADKLTLAFNTPVRVALVDPLGEYDDDLRQGRFQTTTGQYFTLPRPAVELLYGLDPRPGEEVQITRHYSGKPREPITWTIALTPASEQNRAGEETAVSEPELPSDEEYLLRASLQRVEDRKRRQKVGSAKAAVPIRAPRAELDPTGTDGPAPQAVPAASPVRYRRPGQIPMNVAFREITQFVCEVLKEQGEQWGDSARQDLISTVFIAAQKEKMLSPWERGE